jgi:hypothetical protein
MLGIGVRRSRGLFGLEVVRSDDAEHVNVVGNFATLPESVMHRGIVVHA